MEVKKLNAITYCLECKEIKKGNKIVFGEDREHEVYLCDECREDLREKL